MFKSEVLSTLDNPISDFNKVIFEDKFLLFIFVVLSTFKFKADCVCFEIGLFKYVVLSTLYNPISFLSIVISLTNCLLLTVIVLSTLEDNNS